MRLLNVKIPDPDINNSVSESPGGCQGVPDHSVEQEFFPTKFLSPREGKKESCLHLQMLRNLCGRLSQIGRGFLEPSRRDKKVKGQKKGITKVSALKSEIFLWLSKG